MQELSSSTQLTKELVPSLTYFQILGLCPVDRPPTPEFLATVAATLGSEDTQHAMRKAYRKWSIKFHPDKDPSAEARAAFERLKESLDVLSNPTEAVAYIGTFTVSVAKAQSVAARYDKADSMDLEMKRREAAMAARQSEEMSHLVTAYRDAAQGVGGSAATALASWRRMSMTSLEQLYLDASEAWEVDVDILRMKELELLKLFGEVSATFGRQPNGRRGSTTDANVEVTAGPAGDDEGVDADMIAIKRQLLRRRYDTATASVDELTGLGSKRTRD